LSISGGGVGTALGAGLAVLVREALKVPADVSAEAVGAALAVSVVTGLAAGAYPAVAASRVAPIDAMRSE
jgi:putative ABC transport system permease protein